MRRLMPTETGHDERGATAILVAMLMTVILGFAGLAVDLGATYAKRTELQTGADAAALALAQEYATAGCTPNSTMATTWVQQNVNNDVSGAAGTATCPATNRVTVVADGVQEHWFMPVLGKDSSDVSADATVEWGTPVAGSTIPIAISACSFEKQLDKPDTEVLKTVWLPDSVSSSSGGEMPDCGWHEDYPAGGFGVLDNVACMTQITLPGPVVGSAPGGSGWSGCDPSLLLNKTHLIPIFSEVKPNSSGGPGGGQKAEYVIKTFAMFELTGYKIQQGNREGGDACFGTIPEWSSGKTCIVGKFLKYVELDEVDYDLVAPDPSDTVIVIRLVD